MPRVDETASLGIRGDIRDPGTDSGDTSVDPARKGVPIAFRITMGHEQG